MLRRRVRIGLGRLSLASWAGLSACSADPVPVEPPPCSICEPGCRDRPDGGSACVDLPPTATLHFHVARPASVGDYPFGASAPPREAPVPGSPLYVSSEGSHDPEGRPIATFWNAQDPGGQYLTIDPSPTSPRASFVPSRPGIHTVTLQATELGGLRQTGQAQLRLNVAPRPCSPDGVSGPCADALAVPGGAFFMGSRDGEGDASERPRHAAVVDPFALDAYEVTVGRFRRFLVDFTPSRIAEGAGAHPRHPGSGWRAEWITTLPGSPADFSFAISECGGTWTEQAGPSEARPISCISWFAAFAFCAWEGKRLPTEAEWEYAAAGGEQQRRYPWGDEPPSSDLAVYGCRFDGLQACSDTDLPVAGSLPRGAGRFGQFDLAGSLWEWTLDAYAPFTANSCDNCAAVANDLRARVFRGGDFKFDEPDSLRASTRYAFLPVEPDQTRGVRCARSIAGTPP